jgi:Zn-dependent M28 family amino/carboxypeptidase
MSNQIMTFLKKYFFHILLAHVCFVLVLMFWGWYQLTQPWTKPTQSGPDVINMNSIARTATFADPARLGRYVHTLATEHANRQVGHPQRLEAAAKYIEAQLKELGVAAYSQEFEAEGQIYRNIIVKLGQVSKSVTVIGAHYDVAGNQPGADDNASGVAGLLELVRLLKNQTLKESVELVFYTNEEPPFFRTPFMGSAIHAASLKSRGQHASLMISLECIGYFSDEPSSQEHPVRLLNAMYPTVGNFIALVGYYQDGAVSRRVKSSMQAATMLPIHSINAPGFVVGIDFSDHLNYHNEGFVGMMLTDTAFYRNKAYHTPQDTADRLDYQRMAEVVNAARAAVVAHTLDQNVRNRPTLTKQISADK